MRGRSRDHLDNEDAVVELGGVGHRSFDLGDRFGPVVGEVHLDVRASLWRDSGDFLHCHSNETENGLIRETADCLDVRRTGETNRDEVLTDDGSVLPADQIGLGVVVPVPETVLQRDGGALEVERGEQLYELDASRQIGIRQNEKQDGEKVRCRRHLRPHSSF